MSFYIEHLRPDPLRDEDLSGSDVWEHSIAISKDEQVLVRASSGSGKTTFLSILFGMRKDHQGDVYWEGKPLSEFSKSEWSRVRREELGMVFQDLKLFEEVSVQENIMIKNRLTQRFSEDEVFGLMQRAGIEDQWKKPVHQLSIGQKQRVAIVRALCQPFRMLLLDEPFSHLDRRNLEKALSLIQERAQEEGGGFVLASLEDPYGLKYDRTLEL